MSNLEKIEKELPRELFDSLNFFIINSSLDSNKVDELIEIILNIKNLK